MLEIKQAAEWENTSFTNSSTILYRNVQPPWRQELAASEKGEVPHPISFAPIESRARVPIAGGRADTSPLNHLVNLGEENHIRIRCVLDLLCLLNRCPPRDSVVESSLLKNRRVIQTGAY